MSLMLACESLLLAKIEQLVSIPSMHVHADLFYIKRTMGNLFEHPSLERQTCKQEDECSTRMVKAMLCP